MSQTLVLGRSDVQRLLSYDDCIAAVETAFRLHAEGKSLQPGVLAIPARAGAFHVKAAGLELERTYFAVKTNANFPGNPRERGLPTVQGVIVLMDADDGQPLAVLDSMEVTLRRTAAATAVAARHLARPESSTATICGCGVQGRAQLRALTRVLPLSRVHAFDLDEACAQAFARDLALELGLEVRVAAELAEAVGASDVCVTCTPARQAFLLRGHVRPGTFVAGVGADHRGKHELEPQLLAAATLVVDVLEQCALEGDLQHALAAGLMTRESVHAELGDVVAGKKPGRRSAEELTVFDSTGTALEDVAAAAVVYERALAAGAGLRIALGE